MGFIKVTQIERKGKTIASELMLVDTKDISQPLVENISSKTVAYVQESIVTERQSEPNNSVQYVFDETLAAIDAASSDIFVATVVTRNGRTPSITTMGFVFDRVVGGIREEGAGSKFFYKEDGEVLPVEYIVSEDIATIELSL